jgi:hypothetical protein
VTICLFTQVHVCKHNRYADSRNLKQHDNVID